LTEPIRRDYLRTHFVQFLSEKEKFTIISKREFAISILVNVEQIVAPNIIVV